MNLDELEKHIENEFGVDINVQVAVDEEREAWFNIGKQNFNNAYSEDEPDYSDVMIKESNPNYKL